MAKQYNKYNKNNFKKNKDVLLQYVFLFISILLALVAFLNNNPYIAIIVLIIGIVGYIHYHRQACILKSGLDGEKKAREYLSNLSNEYTVLNNIPIEKDGRKTEIDSLVISKYGVYIVEVKNHGGIIKGDADASTWTQIKHNDSNEMKNPLKQLRFQTFLLKDILKENKIDIYVDGCVLFTRAQEVHVNSDHVFTNEEDLLSSIESDQIKDLNIIDIQKIKRILKV